MYNFRVIKALVIEKIIIFLTIFLSFKNLEIRKLQKSKTLQKTT